MDKRRKPTAQRLAGLMTLAPGWANPDTGSGEPIHVDSYHEALRLVEQIERNSLIVQRVMPRQNGGINLEWDFPECEIEVVVEIDPPPEETLYMTIYDGSTTTVSPEDANHWSPSIDFIINTIRKYSYF